jgi:alpha-glucosidase
MDTFERLLQAAHNRGLHIVLDYVPNHSSAQHPWFIESRASFENPKRDWYLWRDPVPEGGPPNNWEAITGGSAWNLDPKTGQYYLAMFHPSQPDLNWRNPEVVAAMHDVLHFWLKKGVDGFRMDMLPFLMKHADMPDNPVIPPDHPFAAMGATQDQRYTNDQPEIHPLLRDFRKLLDSYEGERIAIGETPVFDLDRLARYYGDGDEIHIAFNFHLLMIPWNAQTMKSTLTNYYAALPDDAAPSIVFGNHDFPRPATRFGYENHRSAMLLLLTAKGVPTMYYGDEIGMENVEVPPERLQDPWADSSRGTGRDPERTPMQWDSSANAGFTQEGIKPWLPIGANYETLNVAAQAQDLTSSLTFTRQLLALRRTQPALHRGELTFVEGVPTDVLAYTRRSGDQYVLVVINFGAERHALDLSLLGPSADLLLSTRLTPEGTVNLAALALDPHESLLLEIVG